MAPSKEYALLCLENPLLGKFKVIPQLTQQQLKGCSQHIDVRIGVTASVAALWRRE
jgi:hypothetical protein